MRKARNIAEGKIPLEEFIDKYSLDFKEKEGYGFFGLLAKIEKDGVFIPWQAYWNAFEGKIFDRRVLLFSQDYKNRIVCESSSDYAWRLMHRQFKPSDLKSLSLIREGIRFGKSLFRDSVCGFNNYKNGTQDNEILPQPPKVTMLAEKLVKYYSDMIFA